MKTFAYSVLIGFVFIVLIALMTRGKTGGPSVWDILAMLAALPLGVIAGVVVMLKVLK